MPKANNSGEITDGSNTHLHGINRLVIDAIVSITNIVESLHQRINRFSGVVGHPSKERTSGLSGYVYKGVRDITQLVGKTLDIPLGVLGKAVDQQTPTPALKAMQAALNGVLGDYLHHQSNPLAINMHFSFKGQRIVNDDFAEVIEHARSHSNGKLLIMAHGLCMNDLQWRHNGHNHGEALAQALGFTPLYLNYNSGQHIAFNGAQLSTLLEKLTIQSVNAIRFNIAGHSMGGLVSRSAHQHANKHAYVWPSFTDNMVFLGTPHHGAPLEKTGNWLDFLLGLHPYTVPFAKLIKIRSSGITDLRHGNIDERDNQSRGRFDFTADNRQPVPLPKDIACFAIAGSIDKAADDRYLKILGDGLVPIDSALGRHHQKAHTLQFKPQNQLHIKGVDHLGLLSDQRVFQKLIEWLS